MVRLRCYTEGLELAPERYGLWPSFPKSNGRRERGFEKARIAVESEFLNVKNGDTSLMSVFQQYENEGKWVYEQHPFWCTGYTFWDLHKEAPDLFLHLSKSDLVIFKGDLNHRKVRANDLNLIIF